MIVLDTNVTSEVFRPAPEPRVVECLGSLTGDVAITAITLALAADRDADILVTRELARSPIRTADTTCVTRLLKGWAHTGIDVLDPWHAQE